MISRLHLSALILLAFAIWAVILRLSGQPISANWFAPYATVITVLVISLAAFDIWLWRWRILQGWFVRRPHLWGTWRVQIVSNWIDPATGRGIEPIDAFLTIRQTYSSIKLRMITNESTGDLLTGELLEKDDGSFRLAGIY